MALALNWTLNEVMEHTPRQLAAMSKAIEQRARAQRMAAAHKNAPRGRSR